MRTRGAVNINFVKITPNFRFSVNSNFVTEHHLREAAEAVAAVKSACPQYRRNKSNNTVSITQGYGFVNRNPRFLSGRGDCKERQLRIYPRGKIRNSITRRFNSDKIYAYWTKLPYTLQNFRILKKQRLLPLKLSRFGTFSRILAIIPANFASFAASSIR